MLEFRTGNILDSRMQTLVNAVNTVGVMGKGLALQFKEQYPEMYAEYRRKCENGELTVGTLHLFCASDHWILNLPTKRHYRSRSRLSDIEKGLARLRESYKELGIQSIAIPALGCGHGGLNWKDVRPLIEGYLSDLPIPIEVYEPLTKAGQLQECARARSKDGETPKQLKLL